MACTGNNLGCVTGEIGTDSFVGGVEAVKDSGHGRCGIENEGAIPQ